MKKQIMAIAIALTAMSSAHAAAPCGDRFELDNCDVATTYTGITTIAPTMLTGEATGMTSQGRHYRKLIMAAKEDANVYVASEGQILGVQLASAIEKLRAELPQLAQASDMQIAQEIAGF